MNRADRRKNGIKSKVPTYRMNPEQVKQITKETIEADLERAKKDAFEYATERCVAVMLMSLNREFGFGKKRLQRVLKRFNHNFDCVMQDTVDIDDFVKFCDEKFGIALNFSSSNK